MKLWDKQRFYAVSFLKQQQTWIHVMVLFRFWDGISCAPVWPQGLYVAEDNFKPLILLPLSTECCDYRIVPPLQVVFGAGIQLRALCMIGKHFANWEITLTLFLKVIEDRMFLTLIFTKMVIYHWLKLFCNALVSENLWSLKSYWGPNGIFR